jgi:hypothetical protein
MSVFPFKVTNIYHQTIEEVKEIPQRSHLPLEQPSISHSLKCSDKSIVTAQILLCVIHAKCVTRRQGSSACLHERFRFGTTRLLSDILSAGSLNEYSTR